MPTKTAKPKTKTPAKKTKWKKSSEALVAAFDLALAPFAKAERKQMFGYPSAFVNGNLFTGLFEESMMLRLPEDERARFLKLKGASPFEPMPGRPMREYVTVPESMMKSRAKLKGWLEKSYAYTEALPPKEKKKKKK